MDGQTSEVKAGRASVLRELRMSILYGKRKSRLLTSER
jgi:hypothetical protein